MIINKLYSRFFICVFCVLLLWSCQTEAPDNEIISTDQTPTEGILETKPQNYPSGYGVDFERDSISSLDLHPDFQYDLKMLAWRIQDTITGAYGGRPVVFLCGDESTVTKAKALNVSEFAGIGLGVDGFTEFKYVTKSMQENVKADGVFPMSTNANDSSLYEWKDGFMLISESTLLAAYSVLVIGDKVVRLEEAVSPVWLIETSDGNYFKWQHIERQGGGHVPIRWYQFKSYEIEK
jgi:hypothetical protein